MANRRRVAGEIALWVITLFLVWVFIQQGPAKFSDDSGWAKAFRVWHFPVWFRVLIGIVETSAALLLLFPRTASAGAILIIAVMLGGMGTHIHTGHPGQVRSEVVPLVLATIVAIGRRKAFVLRRHAGATS
jgi:uncharacterized membrane protein YphA (DoxX/SURF4 family)